MLGSPDRTFEARHARARRLLSFLSVDLVDGQHRKILRSCPGAWWLLGHRHSPAWPGRSARHGGQDDGGIIADVIW